MGFTLLKTVHVAQSGDGNGSSGGDGRDWAKSAPPHDGLKDLVPGMISA